MTLLKTLLATALVAASLVSGAHAQDRTIKFAFQNQKDHPQAQGAQKFADLVAAKSGGKIQVKLFPGGTLGGDLQTVSALQGGTVEMTVLNAGILSAQTKEFGIYDFPFLFASPQEADAVTDGPFGKKLLDKLKAKNLVGLAYWELGFRNVTNSKKPITKAEDLAIDVLLHVAGDALGLCLEQRNERSLVALRLLDRLIRQLDRSSVVADLHDGVDPVLLARVRENATVAKRRTTAVLSPVQRDDCPTPGEID